VSCQRDYRFNHWGHTFCYQYSNAKYAMFVECRMQVFDERKSLVGKWVRLLHLLTFSILLKILEMCGFVCRYVRISILHSSIAEL